jgi:hypothetical protein
MNERKTMTLNLTERERAVLEELSRKKELSKTALVRQALRLYQVIDARLSDGERLFFEDEKRRPRSRHMKQPGRGLATPRAEASQPG